MCSPCLRSSAAYVLIISVSRGWFLFTYVQLLKTFATGLHCVHGTLNTAASTKGLPTDKSLSETWFLKTSFPHLPNLIPRSFLQASSTVRTHRRSSKTISECFTRKCRDLRQNIIFHVTTLQFDPCIETFGQAVKSVKKTIL